MRNLRPVFRVNASFTRRTRFRSSSRRRTGSLRSTPRKYCSYFALSSSSSSSMLFASDSSSSFSRRDFAIASSDGGGDCGPPGFSGDRGGGRATGTSVSARRCRDQRSGPVDEPQALASRGSLSRRRGGRAPPGARLRPDGGAHREDRDRRPLADAEPTDDAALDVGAEELDRRSKDGVAEEPGGEHLPVEGLPRPDDEDEEEEEAELAERLVELHGVERQCRRPVEREELRRVGAVREGLVGERLGRELRRPRQVAVRDAAPAAARREAAEPSEEVAERDGRDEGVRVSEEGHARAPHVPPGRERRADEPAVEDEPALPEGEDPGDAPERRRGERVRAEVVVPVHEDEVDAAPDERGDEHPEGEVGDPLRVLPAAARLALREPDADEERRRDEEPVGVERQADLAVAGALWKAGNLDGEIRLPLHTYGLLIASADLVGIWLAQREARRRGQDAERIADLA